VFEGHGSSLVTVHAWGQVVVRKHDMRCKSSCVNRTQQPLHWCRATSSMLGV
jgi:hypothetical protein